MSDFISGAVMMACLVAGLFFLKFWKTSRDRLFLMFGIAFWILGANRIAMIMARETNEERHLSLYIVRLVAFALILLAIIDKNNRKK